MQCLQTFYDAHVAALTFAAALITFACEQEMEKVGSRPYVMVYFNAEAELGAIPDTIFFQQLHAALHPSHKRNLKVKRDSLVRKPLY